LRADGGQGTHKREVGKQPREQDGEAQKSAELAEKHQVACEERQ